MSDVVLVEGETFISSKRAADISGYARDYIGYLARRGDIVARQIGGLWYILQSSLEEYQKRMREAVQTLPSPLSRKADPDTIVTFDGKDYISVSRAAHLTGYHQDYVGQLARNAKILSRQIGKRWYIERESLLAHKNGKDSLLAAVQAESVGLPQRSLAIKEGANKADDGGPHMIYTTDHGDLMPEIRTARGSSLAYVSRIDDVPISARISEEFSLTGGNAQRIGIRKIYTGQTTSRPFNFRLPATVISTIVIVFSIGYVSIQSKAVFTNTNRSSTATAIANRASDSFSTIIELIEGVVAHDLRYKRK